MLEEGNKLDGPWVLAIILVDQTHDFTEVLKRTPFIVVAIEPDPSNLVLENLSADIQAKLMIGLDEGEHSTTNQALNRPAATRWPCTDSPSVIGLVLAFEVWEEA